VSSAVSSKYTALQTERSVRLGAFLLVFSSALALLLTRMMVVSAAILMIMLPVAWFWPRRSVQKNLWEIASFLYLIFFFSIYSAFPARWPLPWSTCLHSY